MKLTLKSLINGSYMKNLEKAIDSHDRRCRKITQEVNKWGKKKPQRLKILNPPR